MMNNLKINFIYQFSYRLLTVLTPLITSPYLSRVLGPDKLGVFSATYAYANYFILLAMLGVEFYGNRAIAIHSSDKVERKKTFWNIYYVQFFATLISLLIYYSTIWVVFDKDRWWISVVQGLWVVAAGLDINWYFFGCQRFKLTVTRNVFIKLFTIISIFLFVYKPEDLILYVFIMGFGMLISQLVMWFFLFKDIGFEKPSPYMILPNVKSILMLSIPMFAFSIFHIMDKTMIDMFSDETNGGCYYNVDRLENIPLGLITGLSTVMLPRITQLVYDNNTVATKLMLVKSSELTIGLSSAVAFGLGSISYEFVPIFFGPGYELCVWLILAFIPIVIVKALSDFIRQQYLIPASNDKLYVIAVIFGALLNLIVGYLLIVRFGALGAVCGVFIAEFLVLIIQIFGCRNQIDFLPIFFKHFVYIVNGFVMFFAVRIIAHLNVLSGITGLLFLIFSGAVTYGITSIIYWRLNKDSIFFPYLNLVMNKLKTYMIKVK